MTGAQGNALEQALALARAPALLTTLRQRALPHDVLTLIRLAAGDVELVANNAEAAGETSERLVEAAVFFIQQVLFAPASDSYRVLGVAEHASDAQIKEHYRWLVKWLHPDRNTDEWDAIYADRINRAWQDLRSAERRADYDRRRASEAPELNRMLAKADFSAPRASVIDAPLLSSRAVRRLPVFVMSALFGVAILFLGLLWLTRSTADHAVEVVETLAPAAEPDVVQMPVATDNAPSIAARVVAPPPENASERIPLASIPPEPVVITERVTDPVLVEQEVQRRLALAMRALDKEQAQRRALEAAPVPNTTGATRSAPPVEVTVATLAPTLPTESARVAAVPTEKPVSSPASPVSPTADGNSVVAATAVDELLIAETLRRFRAAYSRGNIEQMMQMFTADARNNRGDSNSIRSDYLSLFHSSDSRHLALEGVRWTEAHDIITVVADFEAVVVPMGKSKARGITGNMQLDLRRDGSVLRIARLLHHND